jgi:hypothetical protein
MLCWLPFGFPARAAGADVDVIPEQIEKINQSLAFDE